MAHERDPDLVDKPMGHFFIEVGDELYFCLVMKRHLTNLDQMNRHGLLSEDYKKQVVKRLTQFAEKNEKNCHGDIKKW